MANRESRAAPAAEQRGAMNAKLRALVTVAVLALGVGAGLQGLRGFGADRLGAQVAARAAPGDIRMLSSDICPYCVQARAWFTAHRVPFSECSIERDAECAATFRALLAPGTPLLLVRGRRQVGFDPRAVAAALQPR